MIHCQPMVNGEAFLDDVIIHIMFCSKGQNDFASSYILILVSSVLDLLLPYNVYFNSTLYF